MKIVLIGPRGSGKTAVAKRLAQRLQLKRIDMDTIVEHKAGMTVSALVSCFGWDRFREMESAVAADLAECDDCVIDTGGGVVVHAANTAHLKRNGIVILLMADATTLINRIKNNTSRPALTPTKSFTEEMLNVLAARQALYEAAADYTVDTSNRALDQVVDDIINYLSTITRNAA
ncbi:MAG: shikimate kinase [Candidatus Bathyarchaeota archaeon]|jgi:shikimate kinase|nr:shikimate kinase [Candidatus Bathyarchaeota archaeon]